ncbi:CCA tRNA nucleotidyltransferase [Methanobacterium spitsbergense]|uniref:CCA-adding enzyme n=1 Tax=Methanobacterium spitsbergense TaxID=2874285 RepID=A0A8T5V3U9_9EURY|nr:CCA tRNA nucleotidyltransferase [Methanobacterium spitsbergense]MBZ2166541.1 CCA tRNA nucleotidyltransferase [Methanobacterium spitsbergense]
MQKLNYKNILREIKPSKQENEKVKKLSKRMVEVINECAASMDVKADAMLVGSVAKGTWLAGNADIDILIKFPLDTDEKYLKEYGLKIGHESIKKMEGKSEERYASHPYVTGYIEGYYVDFVPCYNIKNSDELKSAVDRTLLHTEYIKSNLTLKQQDEVVLLKKFMESVGTYGSEFKVGGFAGYLCEMLILNYGNFTETLKNAARNWNCGFSFDLEEYGTSNLFKDPLVAIDPVDKNRNVAAALTLQKMSEFIVASENFISNPSEEYFTSKDIITDPLKITDQFNLRGTKTFLIIFKPPNIPADAIYPQIKKTENSIVRVAESEGFSVFGSESWTDEKEVVLILLEFETWDLPRIKKHLGPHIWIREHQERFLEKHGSNAWVEGDRWVVVVERDYVNAETLLSDLMTGKKSGYLKFGKHLKKKIMNEHKIMDLKIFLVSDNIEGNVLEFLYHYLNNGELLFR